MSPKRGMYEKISFDVLSKIRQRTPRGGHWRFQGESTGGGRLPPLTHKKETNKMDKNSENWKNKTNFLFQIVKIRE